MKQLPSRLARLVLALGAVALIWACNAPFIPAAPPGQTASFTSALVSDGAGGQRTVWTAHGAALEAVAFARVSVFDTNQGAGVIALAKADGSYDSPPFDGTFGDRVEISFETPAGVHTPPACFQLAEGPHADTCQPP